MGASSRRRRARLLHAAQSGAARFAAAQPATQKVNRALATAEVGVAGVKIVDGVVNEEYLDALEDVPDRVEAFDKIRNCSAGAVLDNLIGLSLRRASFDVESEDPNQEEMCEVIRRNLLTTGGMTHTWDDFVRHAALAVLYGFSIHEKVWEERNGLLAIRKLPGRHPKTHSKWLFDETGGLAGWEQAGYRVQGEQSSEETVQIPIEKLIVLTYRGEYGNPEGRGVFRAIYGDWYFLDCLDKLAAIKAEREACGVPVAQPREGHGDMGEETQAKMLSIVQRLRTLETGGLVLPSAGVELKAFELGSGTIPFLDFILHKEAQMLRAGLAHFMMLGQDSTGSGRALHEDASALFLSSVEAMADWLCGAVSCYLLRQYVDYNWGPQEVYPTLVHGDLVQRDKTVLAETIRSIFFDPAMTPERYPELNEYLRSELGLPQSEGGPVVQKQPMEEPLVEEPDEGERSESVPEDEGRSQGAVAAVSAADGAIQFAATQEEDGVHGKLAQIVKRSISQYMTKLTSLARDRAYGAMEEVPLPLKGQIEAELKAWLMAAGTAGARIVSEQTGKEVTLGRAHQQWIAAKARLFVNRLEANVRWVCCNGLLDDLRGGQPVRAAMANVQARMIDQVSRVLGSALPAAAGELVEALQGERSDQR